MGRVEVLPLGGAGEIGRNCTAIIQGEDIVVVDCGISFPNEEQHGVQVVIPDFSWLIEHRSRLRGVFLTHAHEDHVGALSWLLEEVSVPVYGTEFVLALIKDKLSERLDLRKIRLEPIQHGQLIQAGTMQVELIHVTHSIPDSSACAIHTVHGVVLMTGDFKIDPTPVDHKPTDLARFDALGREGVVVLLSDSTNVDRIGWGPSEMRAGEGFRTIFPDAPGRILLTTFASNLHRMQQVIDVAQEHGRVVSVAGRRMEQTLDIATKFNQVRIPRGVLVPLEQALEMEPEKVVILTTGSQGEPRSALVQMSHGTYSRLKVNEGDTILYSARAIPGNEAPIWRTVNRLYRLGANVVFHHDPPIHVSGHGYQDELRKMIEITKPFYLAPVHGEPRHQHLYMEMARHMGHPEHRMFALHDGQKLVLDDTEAWTEEYVSADPVLIDDSYKRAVTAEMLREKNTMASQGMVIVVAMLDPETGLPEEVQLDAKGFSGGDAALRTASQWVFDRMKVMSKADRMNDKLVEEVIQEACRIAIHKISKLRPLLHIILIR